MGVATHGNTGKTHGLWAKLWNDMDQAREVEESVALLRDRAARLPEELTRAALGENRPLPLPRGDRTRFVVSGLGASEGPARVLCAVLAEVGLAAVYAPVSAFFAAAPPPGDVLVIVSQRLSPNARIPLRYRLAYPEVVLVTTLDPSSDARVGELARSGVRVLVHSPAEEDRLLLRVLGPAAASVCVTRAALGSARELGVVPNWANALGEVPAAVAAALARGQRSDTDLFAHWVALVCGGGCTEVLQLVRVKLVEGLGLVDPPVWDACGVVHGPFQAFFERSLTLLYFHRKDDPAGRLLLDRLERSIVAERHRVWVHEGTLPGPLILFEHDAAVLGLVLATLAKHPRNLIRWPGKGADGPVYAVEGTEI